MILIAVLKLIKHKQHGYQHKHYTMDKIMLEKMRISKNVKC